MHDENNKECNRNRRVPHVCMNDHYLTCDACTCLKPVEKGESKMTFQKKLSRNLEWAYRVIKDDKEDINETFKVLRTNLLSLCEKHDNTSRLSARTEVLKELLEKSPKEKHGKHEFIVGIRHCLNCGEPRIIIDTQRKVIQQDNMSGGSVTEVIENRIDQTEFSCPKSPLYSGFNSDLSSVTDIIKGMMKEK